MLIADTFRGVHSTGVFGIGPHHRGQAKKAVAAWDFVQLDEYNRWTKDFNKYEAVIGHNRAATQGKVNTANAHPFTHGHITGVHNGTLRNHRQLTGGNKFDVDSEALIYSIMKDGYINTLEKTEGAYALVWWDHKDYKLRMTRNEERPLFFAFVKDRNTLMYASEEGLLRWIAERNKVNIEKTFYVQAGTVVTFDMANLRDYTAENFTVKKTPVVNYGYGHGYSTRSSGKNFNKEMILVPTKFDEQKNGERGTLTAIAVNDENKEEEVVVYNVHKNEYAEALEANKYISTISNGTVIYGGKSKILGSSKDVQVKEFRRKEPTKFYRGYNGEYITQAEFEKAVEDGCSMCSGNIYVSDADSMDWVAWNQPVCPECVKQFAGDMAGVTA